MNQQYAQQRQIVVAEPFLFATLQTFIGKSVVVETSIGNVSGLLRDVKVDHLVIQEAESIFFIRLSEVIWIMPE